MSLEGSNLVNFLIIRRMTETGIRLVTGLRVPVLPSIAIPLPVMPFRPNCQFPLSCHPDAPVFGRGNHRAPDCDSAAVARVGCREDCFDSGFQAVGSTEVCSVLQFGQSPVSAKCVQSLGMIPGNFCKLRHSWPKLLFSVPARDARCQSLFQMIAAKALARNYLSFSLANFGDFPG